MNREDIDLLRLSVIGSVDDGKSTLIGRLLYDSKSIFEDQLLAIEESSKRRGEGYLNLALLTDGLKAEREQGITIDVAYRYFSTPKRKFIIADCPGHIQYTRNMVTGTSSAQASVILVDARNGVVEQTKRHTFLTSLMGVKHLVVCVNKMDLVSYDENKYDEVVNELRSFLTKLEIPEVHFIPISALQGDNIVDKSEKMNWYQGSTLLYTLETIHLGSDHNHIDCRFPIQKVVRPMEEKWHDFRGYAGRVESGVFKAGDTVKLLPSNFDAKIKEIKTIDGDVKEAFHPMSVVITLEEDFDLSRGDMIVRKNNQPEISKEHELMICWLSSESLNLNNKYILRHTSKEVRTSIKDIRYKLDINSLHRNEDDLSIEMNDIARVLIKTSKPLYVDSYKNNKNTGSVVLIDEFSNNTVAAGMII